MTSQLQPVEQGPVVPQNYAGVVMSIAITIVLAAWVYSVVRKAIKGEEVQYPLGQHPLGE